MKFLLTICLSITILNLYAVKEKIHNNRFSSEINPEIIIHGTDSLPSVFPGNHADIVGSRLKNEAFRRFMEFNLPASKVEWEVFKPQLRNEIIEKAGISIDHKLLLDIHETESTKMEGYTIKNMFFQTLPGVYATANLYIPDGKGPFPAVINMNGHWTEARLANPVQYVGQSLALNGYVCLCLDAFGAGERSTVPGIPEYHGANLGSSIMNIGKSLLGIQVSENMRGIDLLCSLPYVDANNIGATGASGGGNQTMWITAMDDRVKASVPVVSFGTFEAYIMESNCVCELLIDGLTLTEESDILAIIAPRAILLLNHTKDKIPAFNTSEMLRSYTNAKPVYEMLGADKNLKYQLFDLPHDYASEDREAMLGWFNLHLKGIGNGSPSKEIDFKNLPAEQLKVFVPGKRDPKVASIQEYCKRKGEELRSDFLSQKTVNVDLKKKELQDILRIGDNPVIKNVYQYSDKEGWKRFSLESNDGKLIPLLFLAPANKSLGYTILFDPKGKDNISLDVINDLKQKGSGIVIVDLYGTGESSSAKANSFDNGDLVQFHTLARAELWLGKTIMGEWINELDLVTQFLDSRFEAKVVNFDASRESGLVALYFTVLHNDKVGAVTLRESPVSYLFDTREGIDFFSMAIHLPGFLNWGDVSLAAALTGKNIEFIKPVSMSGNALLGDNLKNIKSEFEKMRAICHQGGKTLFN